MITEDLLELKERRVKQLQHINNLKRNLSFEEREQVIAFMRQLIKERVR